MSNVFSKHVKYIEGKCLSFKNVEKLVFVLNSNEHPNNKDSPKIRF